VPQLGLVTADLGVAAQLSGAVEQDAERLEQLGAAQRRSDAGVLAGTEGQMLGVVGTAQVEGVPVSEP
jgi:hypothetical protein